MLESVRDHLDAGGLISGMALDDERQALLYDLHLLTAKPVMYVANVSENGFENNPYLDAVRHRSAEESAEMVAVCAAIEAELVELDRQERNEYLDELGFDEPGIKPRNPRRIQASQVADLFHRRGKRGPRLDDAHWCHRTTGRRRDSH